MKRDRTNHLNTNELLVAVVDEKNSTIDAENHLASCARCRGELKRIESQFMGLGEKARQYVPVMPKPIRIETGKKGFLTTLSRWSKPALGIGLAASLMAVILWRGEFKDTVPKIRPVPTEANADVLLDEIGRLVENAMPIQYQQLIADGFPNETDDITDFIVPQMDETEDHRNRTSGHTDSRGDNRC